jgi:hypothetical protein
MDDEEHELKTKLWLQIAKFVIVQEDYKGYALALSSRAMELCTTGTGLKVDQVLAFFPDFCKIDMVREDLIKALMEYNRLSAELGKELDETSNSTDSIRLDIRNLKVYFFKLVD